MNKKREVCTIMVLHVFKKVFYIVHHPCFGVAIAIAACRMNKLYIKFRLLKILWSLVQNQWACLKVHRKILASFFERNNLYAAPGKKPKQGNYNICVYSLRFLGQQLVAAVACGRTVEIAALCSNSNTFIWAWAFTIIAAIQDRITARVQRASYWK